MTFGASAGMLAPAALGAAIAGALVLGVAALVRGPLAAVPENGLKFAVGVMLTGFGTFWAGEGIGIEWPVGDATILAILVGYAVLAMVGVQLVRSRLDARSIQRRPAGTQP